MINRIARLTGLALMLVSIVNCAKVGFGKGGETSASSVSANPDGTVTGTITGEGTPATGQPSVGNTPAAALPKLQFLASACQHGTMCAVEFRLDKPYTKATQLDWHTNDGLYRTPHFPIYAQPSVHYVVTSGRVTFLPGEVSKVVYVQNINPYDFEVIIGVLISNCSYDSSREDCVKFFPDL